MLFGLSNDAVLSIYHQIRWEADPVTCLGIYSDCKNLDKRAMDWSAAGQTLKFGYIKKIY
jgi:hypothetical protein